MCIQEQDVCLKDQREIKDLYNTLIFVPKDHSDDEQIDHIDWELSEKACK